MKLLLLGKNGQLGWELQRALAPLGQVIALDRANTAPVGNIAQLDAIAATVQTVRPDVIVNAAAYTQVDAAESQPELARLVNALAPAALAREAATLGALLVHYSTDYVFDGSGTTPWTENATPAPLNIYGHTKLEGEEAIRRSGCRHLILRSSWIHAARGDNFARKILAKAHIADQLSVVCDQFGAPTGAELIADITAHALRMLPHRPELAGTYHCCASGETSWHGYARFVIDWARAQGMPIKLTAQAVEAIASDTLAAPARRPLNSRLSTVKLRAAFALDLPDWSTGVARMLAEISPSPHAPTRP